ncbi:MAG: PKD domain-containing protein, partial [Candidatus Dormibacteraceae bacterium]
IASYRWGYGDGAQATTTSSSSTHTYSSPGTYTVSVTETSSGGTSTSQVFTGQTMSRNGGSQATTTAVVTVLPAGGPGFPDTGAHAAPSLSNRSLKAVVS